jgi:hypothetical protein
MRGTKTRVRLSQRGALGRPGVTPHLTSFCSATFSRKGRREMDVRPDHPASLRMTPAIGASAPVEGSS